MNTQPYLTFHGPLFRNMATIILNFSFSIFLFCLYASKVCKHSFFSKIPSFSFTFNGSNLTPPRAAIFAFMVSQSLRPHFLPINLRGPKIILCHWPLGWTLSKWWPVWHGTSRCWCCALSWRQKRQGWLTQAILLVLWQRFIRNLCLPLCRGLR